MASDIHANASSAGDSHAPIPVWMAYRRPIRSLDGTIRKWERFPPLDSEILENAFISNISTDIEVQFGRYFANVPDRWLKSYYWLENRWAIVRGTWFWKDPLDGTLCPFGEADAATIEEAYQDIRSGIEEGPIDCELVDTDIVAGTVQFVRETTAAPVPASALSPQTVTRITHVLYRQLSGGRVDRLETHRNFPTPWVTRGEEQLTSSPSHLVLLVHGIGEALYNRQNDPLMGSLRFRGNCDLVREALNDKLLVSNPGAGRIEVLPVEWSQCIHSNVLDRQLESVTLPNLQSVRDFANLALTDVFLYTQRNVKDKLIREIKLKIVSLVKKFQNKNPTVPISFIGHSLGSVVLYDLFSSPIDIGEVEEQILIEPSALFFLGSPLAMFITIREENRLKLPLYANCRLFNVFHPFDAIAYRLEPLVDPRAKDIEPELVPYRGGHRVHVALRKTVSDFKSVLVGWTEWISRGEVRTGATPPPEPVVEERRNIPPLSTEPAALKAVRSQNYNERIDWALQESAVESVSEWVSAVSSHFTYWRHDDVATFIVDRLKRIADAKEKGAFL